MCAAAGKAMAELEWQQAAVKAPAFVHHPYAIAVDRLAAARWLERGRIEERQGRTEQAPNYYREFLRIYDRPVIAHRPLIEEAKAAVGPASSPAGNAPSCSGGRSEARQRMRRRRRPNHRWVLEYGGRYCSSSSGLDTQVTNPHSAKKSGHPMRLQSPEST